MKSGPLRLLQLQSADSSFLVHRFVADVYTELILRFAKSINSASSTLFKAKTSPWAKGAGKKAPAANGKSSTPEEEPEEVDTDPKKLEWVVTPELKVAVVSVKLSAVSRCCPLIRCCLSAICRNSLERSHLLERGRGFGIRGLRQERDYS